MNKKVEILLLTVLGCMTAVSLNLSASSRDDKKILDANTVFFSSAGRLHNVEDPSQKGLEINGGKYFTHVKGWNSAADTLVWGIDVYQTGKLKVTPILSVPQSSEGLQIELMLAGQSKRIGLKPTDERQSFERQKSVTFNLPSSGRYEISMTLAKANGDDGMSPAEEIAMVKGLELSGTPVKTLSSVELRWRPAAVHCGFSCSGPQKDIEMAVYEVTVVHPETYAYFPITSPFGYFGSTWIPETQKFGGVNFSLWSFSMKNLPPPVEKFSHLIAVGEGLYISGFNHEGTGCKARGKNPYESMNETKQILALKKIPGNPYDTYYGYYWDFNDEHWKLYGCGKKFNDGPLTYLKTGAFVEVPGTPAVQRSNHIEREIRFRGWMKDKEGHWYVVDQMTPSGRLEKTTYKNWGIAEDGKFFMQMGGFRPILDKKPDLIKSDASSPMPKYLTGQNLSDLDRLPAGIEMLPASEISTNSAVLNFNIIDLGKNAKVRIYWDDKDGLTYVQGNIGGGGVVQWKNSELLEVVSNGKVAFHLDGLEAGKRYYYRMQIINDGGETWSMDTQYFDTLKN